MINYLSITCDASFNEKRNYGIVAFVIKDSINRIIVKRSKKVKCYSVGEAELRAINKCISYIINKQHTKELSLNYNIAIFSDNKSVINMLKNNIPNKDVPDLLFLDCYKNYSLLQKNNSVILGWIPRELNYEADAKTHRYAVKKNKL